MNLFFSTVGTSSITNKNQNAGKINELSNLTEDEIKSENIDFLNQQINYKKQEALNLLLKNDYKKIKEFSAELNGILSYYPSSLNDSNKQNDYHILLTTDTYVCRKTGELIKSLLNEIGFSLVFVENIKNLKIKDTETFTEGLKILRKKIYEEYLKNTNYKNYRKIFNLTGGFKSVNAFLNILGMFYADEIIYIFETRTDLIKIPKLPLKIDKSEFETKYEEWLYYFDKVNNAGMPYNIFSEIFITRIDNKYILNEWGEMIWDEIKEELILNKGLPDFKNVAYESDFKKRFLSYENEDKINIVLKIARASYLLMTTNNIEELRKDPILELNSDTDGISDYKIKVEGNRRLFLNFRQNKLTFISYRKHEGNKYIEI